MAIVVEGLLKEAIPIATSPQWGRIEKPSLDMEGMRSGYCART